MLNFPTKTLNSIKQLLVNQQKKVEENIRELENEDPVKGSDLPESSEPGTDAYIADTHNKTVIIEDQLKKTKTGIEVALSKIKEGTFGKCEKCGKKIEVSRLLIMPSTQYCISDSKKVSK